MKSKPKHPHLQFFLNQPTMAPKMNPIALLLVLIAISLQIFITTPKSIEPTPPPVAAPAPWPPQFHAILLMNNSGALQKVDLWYDWPNGRNFNIIQSQLGKLTYDLEWDNGTSYVYTLDSNKECRVVHFPVGILRPNWLDGAEYLGQKYVDGFLCNAWTKVDFIWYYEDVVTKRPVHWVFYTGFTADVMTFEVGAVLEDSKWQAPVYCFGKEEGLGEERPLVNPVVADSSFGKLIREVSVSSSSSLRQ